MNKFTIVFESCEEGGYHAYIKEIPGVHAQGETVRETSENVIDALTQLLTYRAEKELEARETKKRFEVELALS
jgi:predicted RNase H-like HicB family nuclease